MNRLIDLGQKAFPGTDCEVEAPLFVTTDGEPRGMKVRFAGKPEVAMLCQASTTSVLIGIADARVLLQKKLEFLLRETGVIVLEGHRLPEFDNEEIDHNIGSRRGDVSLEWHEDGFSNGINVLHRNETDPRRIHDTCFTTASHVYRKIERIWPDLRERIIAADGGVMKLGVPDIAAMAPKEFVHHALYVLRLASIRDMDIEHDTFREMNQEIDPALTFAHTWDAPTSQSVVFWNSMQTPKGVESDILHAAKYNEPTLNGGTNEYIRRKILPHRKKRSKLMEWLHV